METHSDSKGSRGSKREPSYSSPKSRTTFSNNVTTIDRNNSNSGARTTENSTSVNNNNNTSIKSLEDKMETLQLTKNISKDKDKEKNVNKKKVTLRVSLTEQEDLKVFSVRFSEDAKLFAAACGDGTTKVYSTNSGRLAYTLRTPDNNFPIACLRFRPTSVSHKTKYILITAGSDGTLNHWHATSQKCVNTITEKGNQIFAVDYRADAEKFATGGDDFKIRIYDESSKTRIATLAGGHGDVTAGHANRIFSVKFNPENPNLLISGGWDSTIQIWDIRSNHAIRSIFGPHICGDALDMQGNTIVSGSWRPTEALQLWDFSTGKLIDNVPWPSTSKDPCYLYAAQFSKDPNGEFIIAAGSQANEVKIINRDTLKPAAELNGFSRGIYAVDMSHNGKMLGIGGAGVLNLYEI